MLGLFELSNISLAHGTHISVFPNPATQFLTVRGLKAIINFEIVNITGATVLSGVTNGKIDVSELRAGIYVLKTEASQWVKFVKSE